MDLIIAGLVLVGLIVVANLLVVRNNNFEQRLFHWLLLLINVPVFLVGLAFALLPADALASLMTEMGSNIVDFRAAGRILLLMAVWGMIVSLKPTRDFLSRWIPIDVGSPVHTLALIFAGYLIGQSALTLSQGGLSGLAETAEAASIGVFILSEFFLALLALLGVGVLIRRRGPQMMQRLGLERPELGQLIVGVGLIFALVVMQAMAGALWTVISPEQAEMTSDLNSLLLADFNTIWEWLALALAAGIGEELLFRGALQPVLGLGFTSVLFAVVHVNFGFTPITLFIVLLAIILGLVRRYYSTTIAIFVHVGYDFVLGLLVLLLAFLEQFVP